MSNVSIYEKNWIDLVFEDKNKDYGAYQLRQENPKTTLIAFFGGILFLFSLLSIGIILSSFNKLPAELPPITIDDPITPVNLGELPQVKPRHTEPSHPNTTTKIPNLSHMEVAATTQVTVDVPTNENFKNNQNTTPGIGSGIDSPSTGGDGPTIAVNTPIAEKGPVTALELDRLPEYPGGIKKFYEYVGNNFEKPEVDESLNALNVVMSFIIEKDGTMSNIRVLRSSDKNMETEAIRVLRSLKVKWAPGYKDGEKMRTLYTLPIKVAF